METMDVRIEDLEFGYNENRKVLEGVFLKIDGPQLISIIGPNGVGKSTLIHCMNKILDPTGGVVHIEGKDVRDYSVRELAKQMGYVPHATGDSFPMTVMDTVLMGKYPHAGKKVTNADVEEVYGILKLLGIEHLAMRSFDQLSAGQHQKVALARGLAQQPKILLLDEPTSNLDIKHQMDVSRILKEMTEERDMVVVMISHDLNIASKYSDYMIMLHGGGIYAIGTPEEVITPENIKTVYGVESSVILDEGRPHVILRDGLFKEEEHRVNDGVICTR